MDWAKLTHPGTRPVNEDSLGDEQSQGLWGFVVADGLGGHGKGEIASALAVEAFQKVIRSPKATLEQTLRAGFETAQEDILAEQLRTNSTAQMKTTATALLLTPDTVLWGHIGDTRLYAFSNGFFSKGRIKCRTLDHSVPQMLVLAGDIRESDIRNHPDRNQLLRVLGVSGESPRFQLSKVRRAKKFQAFLLCTDGFWELILEDEMERCLAAANSAQQWLEAMAEIIHRRGEGSQMDNLSAIGVIL